MRAATIGSRSGSRSGHRSRCSFFFSVWVIPAVMVVVFGVVNAVCCELHGVLLGKMCGALYVNV